LNEADDKGWPIYLETQERRSANLYARLGFKMLQDGIETLPGGPLTWTMWRAPLANYVWLPPPDKQAAARVA
jgi:hypothetical protein